MKILNTRNKNKQENNHYGKKVIIVLPIFLVCWKLSQLKNFTIFWCLFTIAITLLDCRYDPMTICNIYIYRKMDSYYLLSQMKLTTCIYKGKKKKVYNATTMFETTPFCILTTKIHFFLTTLFLKLQETITRNYKPSKLLFHKQNENGLITTNS